MNYANEEMINMTFVLGECDKNFFLVFMIYRQRYSEHRHPIETSFKWLIDSFNEAGFVSYRQHTQLYVVLTVENEQIILVAAVEDSRLRER